MKRTFRKLRKPEQLANDFSSGWDQGSRAEGIDWGELLKYPRVLLVSEAGAGKTYECQQQAAALFDQAEAAFFLPLEAVAAGGIGSELYGPHLLRFQQWQASSSQVAYFFLDSIDELQLVHKSFRDALKRLAHDLEGALGRATIVVTSRPVAIDRRAFQEILPVPQPAREALNGEQFVRIAVHGSLEGKQDQPPPFIEVELLPLTNMQIIEFSRDQGVLSPEELLSAIDARHALDFARRPQDLIELCDDWREHGEIRSHFEQVKNHALSRVTARPDRREQADLSIEKAFLGAQRLALAAILGRRLTIRYSAGADTENSSGDAPIDPRLLLSDWGAKEIIALLERPIFAEGGYGRVRFHHRSVMEYLAARQIHLLIESGKLSGSAAKRLIFGLTYTNKKLLKPSMRPVAGWLSLFRPDVFDEVLEVEPSTLLTHGDPESLTELQRERALLAFVERYGKGQWRGLVVPDLQVARLAQAALSDTILSAWNSGVENPEVRELLLRLISAGRLGKCADLAASIALDSNCSEEERFEALVALSNLKDQRLEALIEAVVTLAPSWTERIARWVGSYLYPEHVSDAQLIQLLVNVRGGSRYSGDYAARIARVIEKAELSTNRLEALLPGLLVLTRSNIEERDDQLVDQSARLEASAILRALCIRLLEHGAYSTELIQASVLVLRVSETGSALRKGSTELRTLLEALPSANRRQVFEADLSCIAMFESGKVVRNRLVRLVYDGALSYTREKDWQWVLDALSEREAPADLRTVLLQLAVHFVPTCSGDSDFISIRKAAADSQALITELNEAIEANKPSKATLRIQDEQRKRKERQEKKTLSLQQEWLAFWSEVAKRPALALAPGRLHTTIWNLWIVLRNKGGGSEEGRWDRAFLEMHFGHEATNAIRQALTAYWRSMTPSVRSERKAGEKNTYLVVWSIGLVGIYAEAEDPTWASRLNGDEAELAARYALLELNGLPSWLVALVEEHAVYVESILGGELDDELAEPPGNGRWHSTLLQGLRYGPAQIAKLLQPRLTAWLGGPGENLMQLPYSESGESKLDQVVRVLATHGDQSVRTELEDLAANQVETAPDTPLLFFWLPVLCRANAARGTAKLLDILDEYPVEQDGIAVRAIGSLFNERSNDSTDWSSLTSDLLLKLTISIHRHVKPEDDLVHENVYSPSPRDYAENGRRYVFEALMQASGPDAMRAKLELAAHPIFGHFRDWIAALAHERLAAEVDSSVAEIPELATLFEGKELPPKTGTDMAKLLVDRIDDLQELMLRDTGPRAAWAMVNDENSLRPAIARELELTAWGAYTVDQEAVTVDGKETDIRLRSVSGHQATIELKVGEKSRSARMLRDTVEKQLVNKYMAHKMARTGCLLVTVSNPKKRWQHPETKELIDRFQLQELLDTAAQAAQQRLGGDARVIARVLDLTPRLTTEAEAVSKAPTSSRCPSPGRK